MEKKLNSKDKILDYIEKNKKARVEELRTRLGISRQLIHRHLNELIKDNLISRSGTPPLVFYEIKSFLS